MKKIIFILSVLIAGFTWSQEELSVTQALEKSLAKNYGIKLIAANYEISKTQNSWGMAGMIPTFSLNVNNNTSLQDNTNNPATFFPGVLLNDNLQASLNMNWTVFSGFGIRINKERFDMLQAQTKGNAVVVIETAIYDVILAYYTAVVQERKMAVMEELLAYSSEKLEYYRLKKELGLTTSLDMLEFENQVLTDSTNLLLQRLAFKNAKRNLNLLMAEDVEVDYVLTDSLEVKTANATYEDLKSNMMANNSNLKNQFVNFELKDLEVQSKKSAYYPVVSLNLGTTPSVGYFQLFGDNGFSSNTNAWSHQATISVRYDIFQAWNRKRNVQIAEIQQDISAIEIEQMQMQLSHQLRGFFEMYQTRNKIELMASKRVGHAKQLWDLGKEKYDLGLINVFNLNDIKLSFQQAKLSYYDRLFELIQSHYDLMRITGQISQEYNIEGNFDK
ncbi:MAG: TolC family protein [Crocinitomicaceae bacterium]